MMAGRLIFFAVQREENVVYDTDVGFVITYVQDVLVVIEARGKLVFELEKSCGCKDNGTVHR